MNKEFNFWKAHESKKKSEEEVLTLSESKAWISQKIMIIIKEKNLLQKEAAKILGVSQSKVSRLKSGAAIYSYETLFSFLNKLGYSVQINVHQVKDLKS